jgi:Ca2+-binding RTX toxin-like protein
MAGSARAEQVKGGADADVIYGAAGVDTLSGGGGDDIFVFRTASDAPAATPKHLDTEVITDFVPGSMRWTSPCWGI